MSIITDLRALQRIMLREDLSESELKILSTLKTKIALEVQESLSKELGILIEPIVKETIWETKMPKRQAAAPKVINEEKVPWATD